MWHIATHPLSGFRHNVQTECLPAKCFLAFDDGAGGASVGAGAAADASILVNLVDVAFGNGSNGAFASAGTASNTSVSDSVSHCFIGFRVNK